MSLFRGMISILLQRECSVEIKVKFIWLSIEWNYGHTSNLFGYLKNLDKLRVMNGGTVIKIYTVAVILRNLHVGLYGGQSSSYFNTRIDDDFLEKYLRVQNLVVE